MPASPSTGLMWYDAGAIWTVKSQLKTIETTSKACHRKRPHALRLCRSVIISQGISQWRMNFSSNICRFLNKINKDFLLMRPTFLHRKNVACKFVL